MAFTATINSIGRTQNTISVGVTYNDSATGFSVSKSIDFPDDGTTTQASAVAQITAIGTAYKNNLTANNALQSKVGSVITI
jgi:hypothetical protein